MQRPRTLQSIIAAITFVSWFCLLAGAFWVYGYVDKAGRFYPLSMGKNDWVVVAVLVSFGGCGVITSIGLRAYFNWSRISTMLFSALVITLSLTVLIISLLTIPGSEVKLIWSGAAVILLYDALYLSVPLGVCGWFLRYFLQPDVKAMFLKQKRFS